MLGFFHDAGLDLLDHLFSRDAVQGTADAVDDAQKKAVGKEEDQQEEYGGGPEIRRGEGPRCHHLLQFVQYAAGDQGSDDGGDPLEQSDEGEQKQDPFSRTQHQGDHVEKALEKASEKLPQIAEHVAEILGGIHFFMLVGHLSSGGHRKPPLVSFLLFYHI